MGGHTATTTRVANPFAVADWAANFDVYAESIEVGSPAVDHRLWRGGRLRRLHRNRCHLGGIRVCGAQGCVVIYLCHDTWVQVYMGASVSGKSR